MRICVKVFGFIVGCYVMVSMSFAGGNNQDQNADPNKMILIKFPKKTNSEQCKRFPKNPKLRIEVIKKNYFLNSIRQNDMKSIDAELDETGVFTLIENMYKKDPGMLKKQQVAYQLAWGRYVIHNNPMLLKDLFFSILRKFEKPVNVALLKKNKKTITKYLNIIESICLILLSNKLCTGEEAKVRLNYVEYIKFISGCETERVIVF